PELLGSGGMSLGEGGVRRRKQRILRDHGLKRADAVAHARQPALHLQRAGAKVRVVRLNARFVSPPASSEGESKTIDDPARNLVLDGDNICHFAIESPRPERSIV